MKNVVLLLTASVVLPCSAASAQDASLAGTWNVTSKTTTDLTCFRAASPGQVQAYIWIVSEMPGGAVNVSVEGETSFPKLTGRWDAQSGALIAIGSRTVAFSKMASWFKLVASRNGELVGVRRVILDNGGPGSSPCFADFQIVAKKQS